MKMKFIFICFNCIFCITSLYAQSYTLPYTFSYSLTNASPTYNRARADGSQLSTIGTTVPYITFTFKPSISGSYTFSNDYRTNNDNNGDAMGFIYSPSFNPANALTNYITGDDNTNTGNDYRITATLTAGVTYILVSTTYNNANYGTGSTLITGPAGAVLPVTFISFDAIANGSNIDLAWLIGSESNNKGFYIERSYDAINFSEIGFVKSYGSSAITNKYNFCDKTAKPGKLYYRLRQLDLDGKTSFSKTVSVTLADTRFSIYPNPTKGFAIFTQKIANNTVVSISNSIGITVKQKVVNNGINLTGFAPGVYYIRIDNVQNQKLTVVVQ